MRRVRDSNPRSGNAGQQISSLPRSTAPATLLFIRQKTQKKTDNQIEKKHLLFYFIFSGVKTRENNLKMIITQS